MATRVTTAQLNAALDTALTGAVRLSLHTGDPGAAGTSNELTNGTAPGYARGTISFDAAASASKASHADVTFAASGGDWPEVTHVGLWTIGGTFLSSFPLTASEQIADGESLKFAAGDITLAASGAS